jgi:hypothetical protein
MVNLLLENKSPLNATDVSGLTALHHGTSTACSLLPLPMFLVDVGGILLMVCSYI